MSLAAQIQVEQGWGHLTSELTSRIRGWSFNLVMLALQELKNDGVVAFYEVLSGAEPMFIRCVPFRGSEKFIEVSFEDQQVRSAG